MRFFYAGGQVPGYVDEVVGIKTGSMLSSFEIFRQRVSEIEEYPIMAAYRTGKVESHFLDSGAFTLWTRAAKWGKENKRSEWDYYDTDEFWDYIDAYADFIKKYQVGIDFYANVDAIPNPGITWRNQQYMEKEHGLKPVPVIHYKTFLPKWMNHYLDHGYEYIGLGGLVGSSGKRNCQDWLDEAFRMICDTPDRRPKIKVHGFGVTSYKLLLRYPWESVDSVTWAKVGGFGNIMVPRTTKGEWDFAHHDGPYLMAMSDESTKKKDADCHYSTLSGGAREELRRWLEEINVPLGKIENGEVVEHGVLTRHTERRAACLMFFEKFRERLPKEPGPFEVVGKGGIFAQGTIR